MSYDLYVELGGNTQQDVDALVNGNLHGFPIPDVAARIQLLAGIAARNESIKEYAISGDRKGGGGYKSLVHNQIPNNTKYAKELIKPALRQLQLLGLDGSTPDFNLLPPGSWFLQFTFTLAKPWISKDDDPFYVTESVNPVRKDKVFKVPMMSAASWKGLLRWTLMHTRLALKKDELEPIKFAQERFVQTLLFGDEQGEEPAHAKGFAKYVNALKPEARAEYERLLRTYYKVEQKDPLPHHSGRLTFYPTFFDLIDVEVINPHSRKTKAGTHPIYLECVPASASGTCCASGTFSLLYVPFDIVGEDINSAKGEAAKHLRYLAPAIRALFLTYGFSAKRTSGYGVANDEIQGKVKTRASEKPLMSLRQLAQEVKDVAF